MKTNILVAAIAAIALATIPAAANAQGRGHHNDKPQMEAKAMHDANRHGEPKTGPVCRPDHMMNHHCAEPMAPAPVPVCRPVPPRPEPEPVPAPLAPAPVPDKGIHVALPGVNININL